MPVKGSKSGEGMKVEEFVIDVCNDDDETTASGWQTVPDLSCGNRKGTATNSRQLDGRRD